MPSDEELASIIRSRAEVFADEHATVGSECTPMEIGYMGGWKDAIAHFSAIYPEVTIKHELGKPSTCEVLRNGELLFAGQDYSANSHTSNAEILTTTMTAEEIADAKDD